MNKRTRLIILLVCVACFFVAAPILIAYSEGYRFDFETMKVVATGGIYVRTFPTADKVTIDSNISEKPGIFNGAVFVQSLLPKNHTIYIKKAGYYDYSKTLPVEENQVTKLESVLLIKKNIKFDVVADQTTSPFIKKLSTDKFVIKNNNLYYSSTPVLKSLAAYTVSNNEIYWLGLDGFLYKSDFAGKTTEKLTVLALKIKKTNTYKIFVENNNIFVNSQDGLLLLNTKTNQLDNFYSQVKDIKISPDSQKIIYFDSNKIFIYNLNTPEIKPVLLASSSENISNCVWLNNDYIIYSAGNPEKNGAGKVVISEIDYRGNINAITLPQALNLVSPQISFNQQENKLYILTGKTLLVSEKITP